MAKKNTDVQPRPAPDKPRHDFGAPSHDAYDISGKGQGEEVIGGQEGKYPDPNKKQNWA